MIEVGWGDITQQYYVIVVRGKWTSAEMAHAINVSFPKIEACEHTVHVMIDVRYATSPPVDILELLAKTIKIIPKNIDRIVLINHNSTWLRLYQILKRVYSADISQLYFVKTINEAYQLIMPDDSSQNDEASDSV